MKSFLLCVVFIDSLEKLLLFIGEIRELNLKFVKFDLLNSKNFVL